MSEAAVQPRVPVRRLLALAIPSLLVGVLCALALDGLSAIAQQLERWVWDDLSSSMGVDPSSAWWIIGVLTVAGLLVGLVVHFAPGHGGPDPATTGLVEPPLPLSTLPGLAVALVVMLAGGVSLGPENPIMAINAALVVWLGSRAVPKVAQPQWMVLSIAGTIGAMFGTPVAVALMFSELDLGDRRVPLWDRLFAPLLAATTGALVTMRISELTFAIDLPAYTLGGWPDLVVAILAALAAAVIGIGASYVFTPLHRMFRRIGHPVVAITLGGVLLGLLGAWGGRITLFKGLDEIKELPGRVGTTTAAGFLLMALIKVAALLIASASGFRGGRIFPATFAGVAMGFALHQAVTSVPLALAVGGTTTGLLVAVTRSGWLSLFLVVSLLGDATLLPALLLASLAAWLLVANRPELRATDLDAEHPHPDPDDAPVAAVEAVEEKPADSAEPAPAAPSERAPAAQADGPPDPTDESPSQNASTAPR